MHTDCVISCTNYLLYYLIFMPAGGGNGSGVLGYQASDFGVRVLQHLSVKLDITDQGSGRFTNCKHVTHWIY